jgi:hypothetical protein
MTLTPDLAENLDAVSQVGMTPERVDKVNIGD